MSEEIPIEIHNALEQIASGGLLSLNRVSGASRTTLSKQRNPPTKPTSILKQPNNTHRACAADECSWVIYFKRMPRIVVENFTGRTQPLSGRKP